MEIHARAGAPVNPAAESDEDLKLIAINSLMQSDPNQALPILEKLLKSNNSPKLKERALFVLTQSGSPEARKILSGVALGGSNPDLQRAAIRNMGMLGSDDARRELASIYASSQDKEVRRAILQAFMVSGSREFLFNAAKTEKDPDLRREAIHELGVSGGHRAAQPVGLHALRERHGRRGTGDADHVVVLRQPVSAVTPPLRMLRQIERIVQRIRRGSALNHKRQIQDREISHPYSFPISTERTRATNLPNQPQ